MSDRFAHQPDLFVSGANPANGLDEPPPADFIDRIRTELVETLARAREAATLPWPDLTRATLVELRFKSIADWLPKDEADALRADFSKEMARLYAAEP